MSRKSHNHKWLQQEEWTNDNGRDKSLLVKKQRNTKQPALSSLTRWSQILQKKQKLPNTQIR